MKNFKIYMNNLLAFYEAYFNHVCNSLIDTFLIVSIQSLLSSTHIIVTHET